MDGPGDDIPEILRRALAGGRVASAYLLSGAGESPRAAALAFARAAACTGPEPPCGACRGCRLAAGSDEEPVAIDGTGKKGPLFRHVGDHPDLLWTEREHGGTRVRIGQVRAVQAALQLGANEGGRRVAVVADAEWLNVEAQNALLRLLEEPPPDTSVLLVAANASALLATIRSRCQRVRFPASDRIALRDPELPEERGGLVARFDALRSRNLTDLLDWAEEYRGPRAPTAERVNELLAVGSEWLCERVKGRAEDGDGASDGLRAELDAFRALSACRRDLAQRNANPQMVAERALFAMRGALA